MFDNDDTNYAALGAISLDRLRLFGAYTHMSLTSLWMKITTKSVKKDLGSDMYELRSVRH